MRIFLTRLFHETNTFVEQATRLEDFRVARGEEMLAALGDDSPVDGFLSTALSYGWQIVPGVDFICAPSGPLPDEVFEAFWAELLPRLTAALSEGIEAIFLVLHGAMATENIPDVEGELLQRIRALSGATSLPIMAVLDLHANVSERMVRHAVLIPYRENPHSDARETAVRATKHLRKFLIQRHTPRTYYRHSRILLAPPSTGSANNPLLTLNRLAREIERSAGHLEIGIAPGFAHADTPDTGLTVWIISDRPEMACHLSLEALLGRSRQLAAQLETGEWSLDDAVHQIQQERRFPALLIEPADNIGGGAPGDATFLLRALLRTSLRSCVVIADPAAVAALAFVDRGEKTTLSIGGHGSSLDLGPVDLEVTLASRSEGDFELEDKQSHLASMGGSRIAMGPCAVVTHKNVTILLTSIPTPPFDLGQLRSQGIEPSALEVIGVKAAVGHRRSYDPIAGSSYTVRTPGPCTSDLASLPYRKVTRPIYPLDAA